MPTIAFILETFYGDHIGGAERQVQMIAEALRASSWRTVYICQRSVEKPARESVSGMDVIALPPRKRRSAWLNYRALRQAMIQSEADIFYQRVRHPYTGLAVEIARRLRTPIVFAAASKADVYRRRDLRWSSHAGNPLDELLHPLNRWFEDRGIARADAVILQTEEQLELLRSQYRREGVVIPNHIVISNASPAKKNAPPEVLWISNIKPFKRPELFLDLAKRCVDLPVRFVMIGGCASLNLLKEIKAAEEALANVMYLGPLNPKEAEKRIAGATLLVNTSEFEGFPNAFQQAWANGVPTFSLGVDPDGVITRKGLGGCFATIEELENGVRRILSDDKNLKVIASQARDFARSVYDLEKILPRYLTLFKKLLQR